MSQTRTENIHFLHYAISRVAQASGMTEEHGDYIADAITFAHRQGKLNQGLGVYECIELCLQGGVMNPESVPEVINEGDSWAVIDGHGSSGYYALTKMAELAIEKAKTCGVAIVYGGNHNDAGSFAKYVHMATEAGMMAMASNNSVPLAAPFGGMENKLSCPPFDALAPSGKQPPIWTSIKFGEFYDADIAEACLQNQPMKGEWLIDPITGEVSDDATKYGKPIPGFGRVWDYTCAGQLASPRTYTLNLWNEAMTAIMNPIGRPSTAMPTIDDFSKGEDLVPSVGGSYYLCINSAIMGGGGLDAIKDRSDQYVKSILDTKPRPGQSVRMPGQAGYNSLQADKDDIEILTNHWDPFFDTIAGNHGLSEAILRKEFSER